MAALSLRAGVRRTETMQEKRRFPNEPTALPPFRRFSFLCFCVSSGATQWHYAKKLYLQNEPIYSFR